MPIYEYNCLKCGVDYSELAMTVADETKVHCPDCGSTTRARLYSAFGLVDNLMTNMPKPYFSCLPTQFPNQVRVTDLIEAKDLPKKNR